jgi:creatinine amidohydrolase
VPALDAGDLSWPDLDGRLRDGVPLILPVGSMEQHGPHLPLATDAIIVDKLAHEVAGHAGALVLPNLPYGAPSRPRSGGGDLFPAPSLPLATLLQSVEALATGVLAAGCRYLVVLSWHMENAAVLWDALVRPAQRTGAKIILFDAPWDFLTTELEEALFPQGPDWPADHAGRLETAVMRHLAPGLVGPAPAPVPFSPRRGYDVLPTPADAVPSTGVVLDARSVTPELGSRCFEAMIDGVVSAVRAERPQS